MNNRLSLRTELLVSLAIVSATALTLAVASVLVLYDVLDQEYAAIYISALVAADVCILVGFVAYQVDKVVLRPLRRAMATAEAIADGDLARRLDAGDSEEMHHLATSVNRMTDRLLEERAHLVRTEKLASVGRLAAGVAHEIGNPLGAINGYLHLLRKRTMDHPSSDDALSGLERECARIDRIVRGLLDYARPKHRSSGNVDLNDVVHTVTDLLSTQGVLRRIDLRVSPAEHARVAGDRHDLEQVLVNLLLNAADAMHGVGHLEVILRRTTRTELLAGARRATDGRERPLNPPSLRNTRWLEKANEELVMVIVADSGPGVSAEDADRIFDPFFTTKEPGKGTGLGLAIVARSVENAGGIIWVSPSREGGAAFRMLFPAATTAPRRSLRVEGSVVARAGVS